MKRRAFSLLLGLLLLAVGVSGVTAAPKDAPKDGTAIGARVPEFKAKTVQIKGTKTAAARWSSRKTRRPTAYIFVGTECPATKGYMERLRALEQAYAGKVDFVFVYPNSEDTSDEKLAFHAAQQLAGPLIDDQGAAIAKLLAARKTSEVLLADKKGIILYRGAIDDARDATKVTKPHVATALDEHLSGKAVTTTVSDVQA